MLRLPTTITLGAEDALTVDLPTASDRFKTMDPRNQEIPPVRSAAVMPTAKRLATVTGFAQVPMSTPSTLRTSATSTLTSVDPLPPLPSPRLERLLTLPLTRSTKERPAHTESRLPVELPSSLEMLPLVLSVLTSSNGTQLPLTLMPVLSLEPKTIKTLETMKSRMVPLLLATPLETPPSDIF